MDIVSSGLNIDAGKLYAYAVSTARLLSVDGTCSARAERRRLREEMRTLRRRYRALCAKEARGQTLTGAEEWILDNYYLARREAQSHAQRARGVQRRAQAAGKGPGQGVARARVTKPSGQLFVIAFPGERPRPRRQHYEL